VKGVRDDPREVARGEQVGRYLERYGQVLVTNYREFVLMGRDRSGGPVEIESFRLAEDPDSFWRATQEHHRTAVEKGPGLAEFLKRALLHGAPLSQPRDLAWFLASHAREALFLVESTGSLHALTSVREALEEALGVSFEGERANTSSDRHCSKRYSMVSFPPGSSGASRDHSTAMSTSTGGSPPTYSTCR
jgi:hypothetical protein